MNAVIMIKIPFSSHVHLKSSHRNTLCLDLGSIIARLSGNWKHLIGILFVVKNPLQTIHVLA